MLTELSYQRINRSVGEEVEWFDQLVKSKAELINSVNFSDDSLYAFDLFVPLVTMTKEDSNSLL